MTIESRLMFLAFFLAMSVPSLLLVSLLGDERRFRRQMRVAACGVLVLSGLLWWLSGG